MKPSLVPPPAPFPASELRCDSNDSPGAPFVAELTVERYLAGGRIDTFLLRHFRNYTPFAMHRMIHAGLVQVNGVVVPIEHRVRRGECVSVQLVEPPDKLLASERGPLDVVYEDPWLIVVNKPPGQIAHPVGRHNSDTLCNAVQYHLDRQTPRPGLLRPGIVHRIDRYTSGLIVVTKEHLSHRLLSIEFQRANVRKEYIALVDGLIDADRFTIDRPIGQAAHDGCVLMTCGSDARDPRPAETQIEVLERFAEHTLVRAKPRTGRNHQIRVHLAGIGHPIVADECYGPFGVIKPTRFDTVLEEFESDNTGAAPVPATASPQGQAACDLISRHALHASRIEIRHPISRELMRFEAPLPRDIHDAIAKLFQRESRGRNHASVKQTSGIPLPHAIRSSLHVGR